MLSALPCGGFGEQADGAESMEIRCLGHRVFERDARGAPVYDYDGIRYRDAASCGAVTNLDHHGQRVVVGHLVDGQVVELTPPAKPSDDGATATAAEVAHYGAAAVAIFGLQSPHPGARP